MAENLSGVQWTGWPLAGALGAGRHDELTAAPEGFGLTPSGQAERAGQESVQPAEQEIPSAGSEQPG